MTSQTPLNYELCLALADYVYYGLSIRECTALLGLRPDGMRALIADARYLRIIIAAKAKAKFDLLKTQMDIALNGNHEACVKASQYLLASRYDVVANAKELRQQLRQHRDNMDHKHAVLQQWADYRAATLVSDATHQQLAEWSKEPPSQ